MKITTGEFKNRSLSGPKDPKQIRMTTGLIRKAVIDKYQFNLKRKFVLELYAGTGSVGIELLSNGVSRVVFTEIDTNNCEIIRKNLNKLGIINDKFSIINNSVGKALNLLHDKYCFDLIYLDPPYKENLVTATLLNISEKKIYSNKTIIIAEHHYKEKVEEEIGKFKKIDSRQYGMTVLDFFKC